MATKFSGEFHCYRKETAEITAFLKAFREGDVNALVPLTDWLIERGDPRSPTLAEVVSRGSRRAKRGIIRIFFGMKSQHTSYLFMFNNTRHVARDPAKAALMPDGFREPVGLPLGIEAEFFVGGVNREDASILDYGRPPSTQPSHWCQWKMKGPRANATSIVWDSQAEPADKFCHYIEWLRYLLDNFLTPWEYDVNGKVEWQGEAENDRGTIIVCRNEIEVVALQSRR